MNLLDTEKRLIRRYTKTLKSHKLHETKMKVELDFVFSIRHCEMSTNCTFSMTTKIQICILVAIHSSFLNLSVFEFKTNTML